MDKELIQELISYMSPCPFCGSDKVRMAHTKNKHAKGEGDATYFQGICNKCYCRGPKTTALVEALRLWNDRDNSVKPNIKSVKIDSEQVSRFLSGEIVLKCETYTGYLALVQACSAIIPNLGDKELDWTFIWYQHKSNTVVSAKSSIIDENKLWFGFSSYRYYKEDTEDVIETLIVKEVDIDEIKVQ